MPTPSIAHVLNEYLSFGELLDDAYWEASAIEHKDFIYNLISLLSQELLELKGVDENEQHYHYEFISERIRRIFPKLTELENNLEDIVSRTQTLTDMKEVLSNVIAIIEEQSEL